MALEIKHGMHRSCTGSSQLRSGSEVATTFIQGPSDTLSRAEAHSELCIEVRFRHSAGSRPHDNLVSAIIERILARYVIRSIDCGRTMVVGVCSNSTNLSLICNSVLVACLDGGIPLREMFYCTGTDSLCVVEGGEVVMRHGAGAMTEGQADQARREAVYIKESVEYGLRDMLVFE